MSSSEYYDQFLKSQTTGKYQIFVFDMVNSKLIPSEKRNILQTKMVALAEKLYELIVQLEKRTNAKILVYEDGFTRLKDNQKQTGFGLKTEPFILGDMFGITIYRNSINPNYIIELFNKLKKEFELDVDFHINNGYYETNDYNLGNELFFRGYCIDIVSKLHKENFSSIRRKLTKIPK